HLYYRCDQLDGNQKLAMQKNPPGLIPGRSTIAETRGRGGYVLVPGCPSQCHPSGGVYKFISGSFDLDADGNGIPTISAEQRSKLFAAVRSFDQVGLTEKKYRNKDCERAVAVDRDGNRPGDDFNRRARWEDVLLPLGWTFAYRRRNDGAECWRRPGKSRKEKGISATVRNFDGVELFHSFSSNSDPLPFEKSITKFEAYTIIHHHGDFEASARDLAQQGYGEPSRKVIDLDAIVSGKRDESVPWSDFDPGLKTRIVKNIEIGEVGDGRDFIDGDCKCETIPLSDSVFYEEMDPLEVQIFEDKKKLDKEEKERIRKEKYELRKVELNKGPAYLVWRDFGDPPQKKIAPDGRIKTRIDCPRDTAWIILNDWFSNGDGMRTIHYQNEQFMMWNGRRYRSLKSDDVRPLISQYMSHFAEFKGEDENGNQVYEPFKIRNVRIIEMVKAVQDLVHIDSEISDPCWLGNPQDVSNLPDPREIVCCENGLLDIAKKDLLPPTPAFYSFNNTGIR